MKTEEVKKEHREITLEQLREEIKAQGVEPLDYAVICPVCKTVQSARWLIKEGAGADFEGVRGYLGFSCVGRFNGAGDKREEGKGCNWTLGGLFQLHDLTVITPDGGRHPHFEIASKEQAEALIVKMGVQDAAN